MPDIWILAAVVLLCAVPLAIALHRPRPRRLPVRVVADDRVPANLALLIAEQRLVDALRRPESLVVITGIGLT